MIDLPRTEPVALAPETFLITNLYPAGPSVFLPVCSMLIRGAQPVIIDTGAPIHRELWLEQMFTLVDPEDVRWIFLSHDDGDHTGALYEVLERCPQATLIANFFTTERLALESGLPLDRMIWREQGDVIEIGDRRLRLIVPPIFDGPTTRGVLDESTGAMWAVDSFAAMTTGQGFACGDIPVDLYDETFSLLNSLISPWHQWLDPRRYDAHIASVQELEPSVVANAHGPVYRGTEIDTAFGRVREMAGAPLVPRPGQETLDEMLAATLVAGPAMPAQAMPVDVPASLRT